MQDDEEYYEEKAPAIIYATNDNIRKVVHEAIREYGEDADLNHIDVRNVTNMDYLFSYYLNEKFDTNFENHRFNGDISMWDVSKVKSMVGTFECSQFDGDISNWNVSNVKDMSCLFMAGSFNGDISKWDVSHVTSMDGMFGKGQYDCGSAFNGDISQWNVSNVKYMHHMFENSEFNGDISNWNVSNVEYMDSMFMESQFNRDISNWDVSNVTSMDSMFKGSEFNGNISQWEVSKVNNMAGIFQYSPFGGDVSAWKVDSECSVPDALKDCPASESPTPGVLHFMCKAQSEDFALSPDAEAFYDFNATLLDNIEDPSDRARIIATLYQERNQAQPLIDFTMGLEPSEQAMGSSGFSFDAPDEQSTGLTI